METQQNNDPNLGTTIPGGDIERQKVLERFGPYRRPTDVTAPKFKQIQEKAQELALLIHDLCPYSPQRATALTQLEMCKMSANAAIAIHQGEKL